MPLSKHLPQNKASTSSQIKYTQLEEEAQGKTTHYTQPRYPNTSHNAMPPRGSSSMGKAYICNYLWNWDEPYSARALSILWELLGWTYYLQETSQQLCYCCSKPKSGRPCPRPDWWSPPYPPEATSPNQPWTSHRQDTISKYCVRHILILWVKPT